MKTVAQYLAQYAAYDARWIERRRREARTMTARQRRTAARDWREAANALVWSVRTFRNGKTPRQFARQIRLYRQAANILSR